MSKINFEIIITKYLNNEASVEEMDSLVKWLENDKNHNVFKDYVTIHHNLNKNTVFNGIASYNNTIKTKAVYKKPIFRYAVAASLILFISLAFMFNNKSEINTYPIITSNIKKGTDKAILTLENGDEVTLEKNQQYKSNSVDSDGETLIYKTKNEPNYEITYNHLTIPRGGQFFVQLSDGTKVWLNSESKLKYPTQFVNNETRKVELLYGEAYFDVSKSTNHNGAGFKVITKTQEISVLGTAFNIKAYENESTYTTLVEGNVSVSNYKSPTTFLKPNEQAITNRQGSTIQIREVDVKRFIAWKNGFFVFENETLSDIMKTLSRWYNITVVYENQRKKNMLFSGQLLRKNTIESMLSKFEKTGDIEFKIDKNIITIK